MIHTHHSARLLSPGELEKWDAFVQSHPAGSIYHTSLWGKVLARTYGHQFLVWATENSRGRITAGIPLAKISQPITGRRLESVPAAQYCNPLADDEGQFRQLQEGIREFMGREGIKSLQLKTSEHFAFSNSLFAEKAQNYFTFVAELNSDLETLQAGLHKSCIRRPLKKAERLGMTLSRARSENDLRAFYDLYLQMRRENHLFPMPFRFFSAMWNELHPPGHLKILFARLGGDIISTVLLLKYGGRMVYEYGATAASARHLSPGIFLLWEAIKLARNAGCREFDFGRTAADNAGLIQFKKRWGAQSLRLNYYFYPRPDQGAALRENPLSRKLMSLATSLFPKPVFQLTGWLMYKYIL